MRVTLTNENKGLEVHFYDYKNFESLFGYNNTLPRCYPYFVEENKSFLAFNFSGFFDNNRVNPYTTRGVNENGVNFKSNYFEAKQISWEFRNVFQNPSGLPNSPNNYLSALLLEKNDVIKVTVETYNSISDTTNLYTQYFFVTENTSTEEGVIELITSGSGADSFWSLGEIKERFLFFDQGLPYIVKNLPQILLEEKTYPFLTDVFNNSDVEPIIRFGGNESGYWSNFTITNNANGTTFTYDNTVDNDLEIIVDNKNNTCVNQDGLDRSSNLTGSFDFLLENGNNQIQWYFNDVDYMTAEVDLPLNTFVEISREGLVSSIE